MIREKKALMTFLSKSLFLYDNHSKTIPTEADLKHMAIQQIHGFVQSTPRAFPE